MMLPINKLKRLPVQKISDDQPHHLYMRIAAPICYLLLRLRKYNVSFESESTISGPTGDKSVQLKCTSILTINIKYSFFNIG